MQRNRHSFKGKWICGEMTVENRIAPVFKKEFTVKDDLTKATAFVCGLGLFELRVNGTVADDTVLNPANTQYTSTVLYRVFDITHLLKQGKNIITVELGNGFYNETVKVWNWDTALWRDVPKLIADFELIYGEKRETIVTDETWLFSLDGQVIENSIYYGETVDLRKTPCNWQNALLAEPPRGELREQNMPPIRRIASFKPKCVKDLGNNTYIVEAPQMVTGWAKLNMEISFGEKLTVTYGESLLPDGKVVHIGKFEGRDGDWYPKATIQQDNFIGNGKSEAFEPRFSYKGFKYIQLDNCPVKPTADNTVIYQVANDVSVISEFECSERVINHLHNMMKTTLLNNFQGKPTDTPVWEKNGWLGDASCGLLSMVYNFDLYTFLGEFINTMKDCFTEYGVVPIMVPTANWGVENSPVWNTVFVHATEVMTDFYGDLDFVKELYPHLKAFALKDIAEIKEKGGVWDKKGLADWVAPVGFEPTCEANPNSSEGAEICATAYIYNMLKCMVRIATALNEKADARIYIEKAEKIKEAFNNAFYNTEKGYYQTTFWHQIGERTPYRQTSNLLPLAFDMVPEDNKRRVLENLVNDIKAKGCHLDTGCTGTKYVLPVLFDNGYSDLAFKILTQTTYPSWGYWVEKGSSSAWESWEDTTRSKNHYFLATYEEALFTHLAGIKNVKNGFKSFDFCPHTNCGLDFVKAKIKTPYGDIKCFWEKDLEGNVNIQLDVPPEIECRVIEP